MKPGTDINKLKNYNTWSPMMKHVYNRYYCETDYTLFTGDIRLESAMLFTGCTFYDMLLHDLDFFERNPGSNIIFACCPYIKKMLKDFVTIFGLDVTIFTSDEIGYVEKIETRQRKREINSRWVVKHRNLILNPMKFKKILLYDHDHTDVNGMSVYMRKGFIPVCLNKMPIFEIIDMLSGADEIVNLHDHALLYAIYCKPGCQIYDIRNDVGDTFYNEYIAEINKAAIDLTVPIRYATLIYNGHYEAYEQLSATSV